MKKRTLLFMVGFAALGVLNIPLFAQDFTYRAGGRAGLNFGWFSGDDWENSIDFFNGDSGIAIGSTIGGFLEIGVTEHFAVQPELLISLLQGKYSFEDAAGDDQSVTINLRVLELPILAKGRLPAGPGTIYGVAGPDLLFILGDVYGETRSEDFLVIAYGEPDNRFLFGLAVGAGYEYPIGPGLLSGEIRYTRVLSQYDDDFEAFSNSITVSVAYGFDL